jgi:hypothetical protein
MGLNYYTDLDLERVLVQRLNVWLGDFLYLSPQDNGREVHPIEIVRGYVPSFQAGPQMEPQNKAPVVAVRSVGGWHTRLEGAVEIHFFILLWDRNLDRTGVLEVKNVKNRIIQGIYEEPVIDHSYPLLDNEVQWSVIEDPSKDHFPYFIGGVIAHYGIFTWSPIPDSPEDREPSQLIYTGSTQLGP